MNKTIQEYARERGVTPQAIYVAIKRHNVPTIQGVSNGKPAGYLDDEAQAILDQVMKPTQKSNEIAVASLQLEIANREIALLREKELEVEETRVHMLARVEELSSGLDLRLLDLTQELAQERTELKTSYERELNQIKQELTKANEEITRLNVELVAAYETIKKQTAQIKQLEEHPFKEWNTRRKEAKNGKPKETN